MANPTLLDMPIARDGAKNSIPSTTSPTTGLLSQQYGWQDINSMPVQQGGKAPSRLDFNGVLNLLSKILFYCQKGWQFEWNSSQAYYAGCVVKDTSDGKMYMCLNDVTSTTAPHSDSTNWKLWDLSMLANYLPLSGGTMTGQLKLENTYPNKIVTIAGTDTSSLFELIIGTDRAKSPALSLNGGTNANADYAGSIQLRAANADSSGALPYLALRANGSLIHSVGTSNNDLGGSAIVSKSLGGVQGYIKYASGVIYQWGMEAVTANIAKDIYFPISFAESYFPQISPSQASGGVMSVTRTSNTKMTVTNDTSGYIFWFAIGK